ncbi:TfoX/Sxy family DNA transformation protein [Lacibacterium aquatile]|uniref:TfoX/Sxy family DNA transformation protein n=1 Tax=Lacibacterium aquatile TaxID=1168082 RepID=A0ABW5DWZ8_9PROT
MANLEDLPNLGMKTAKRLRIAGIADSESLLVMGAAEAYRRLKTEFPRDTSLNALWALAGAIEGRHWQSYTVDEKAALKAAVARD